LNTLRTFREHRNPVITGAPIYVPGPTTAAIAKKTGLPESKIIKLSSNEAPLGPSPRVREALRDLAVSGDELHRYPSPDMADLRTAIGKAIGLDADWILPCDGSSETWPLIVRAYSQPGESVLCVNPSQVTYEQLTVLHERSLQVVRNTYPFDVSADTFLAKADDFTRVVFVSSPNNATSRLVQLDDIVRLAEALPEAVVVVDEHYIEATPHYAAQTAISLVRSLDNLLVTRTFSKMYGLAGLRIGYVAGAPEKLAPVRVLRSAWAVSLPAKAAAIAALADESYLAQNIAVTSAGRQQLEAGLRTLSGVELVPEAAGGFLLFRVRGWEGTQIAQALLEHGVVVRGDLAEGFVRVSVGTANQNEQFLASLTEIVAPSANAG
jgi:histidinol-phosphate aminotransferase